MLTKINIIKKQIKKTGVLFVFFTFVFIFNFNFLFIKNTIAQTGDFSGDSNNTPIPAQIQEIKQQLDINVSPEVPKPNEDVTITVETYGLDLNSVDIQWLINGKIVLRGFGAKKFTFNVGDSKESRVIMLVSPKNQPQISRFWVFNPSNVDLLWQAETYTPPFYKGKALFSPEASATMVAIPNFIDGGKRISDTNVVYKWSVDREVQGDNSGYGQNYFKYTADILPIDKEIEVEAYPSGQESRKGVGSTNLSTKSAFMLFYEDNPTNGIMFNYSLSNQISLGSKNEAKICVFPYNFSTTNKKIGLEYSWYINSEKIDMPNNTNSVTIRKNTEKNIDIAGITVNLANPTHIMQTAINGIDFLFSKN